MFEKMNINEFDIVFNIMDKSFPDTEMRIYNEQKKLLDDEKYSILVKKDDNKNIIGFICYWELTDFVYIEHFAVDENQRGKNIGANMINEFCRSQQRNVVLEVEYPEDDISIRRINFYKRNGFFINEYKYLQPPMRIGNEFLPLKIMSFNRIITEKEYKTLENDLYTIVYKYKK